MIELYFTIKVILMIVVLSVALARLLYKVWKWFH